MEGILKKKKDEEHLKRLEFEEQRIKEESVKMKREAEEKRKRDLEDLRLQELLKEKEESKAQRKTKTSFTCLVPSNYRQMRASSHQAISTRMVRCPQVSQLASCLGVGKVMAV